MHIFFLIANMIRRPVFFSIILWIARLACTSTADKQIFYLPWIDGILSLSRSFHHRARRKVIFFRSLSSINQSICHWEEGGEEIESSIFLCVSNRASKISTKNGGYGNSCKVNRINTKKKTTASEKDRSAYQITWVTFFLTLLFCSSHWHEEEGKKNASRTARNLISWISSLPTRQSTSSNIYHINQ